MDTEEPKKYTILENVLQNINGKYIALPNEEKKRNNKLMQVIDRIIHTLRNKSTLFDNLYQNKFYGGSYYDGMKVGKPSEYDLDCLLCLPKIVEPSVEVSDKPGYVHIVLKNMEALTKNEVEAPKYAGLDKLLDGNRLSTKKLRSWMESLMSAAVNGNSKAEITVDESGTKCIVKYYMVKSGPALTIKLEGTLNDASFKIDIDLVPCFTFFSDQWPKKKYRCNPSQKRNTFFVVPKSPSAEEPLYWRLSFQEQERELLNDYAVMKPTIRLIKKIRDRHEHKIASYFIKTVFLWEQEKLDKSVWNKPLSFVFVMMLKKYSEYIEKKEIPYYWNPSNNLIGDLTEITASCIANKIKHIVDHFEKICNTKSNIYDIVPYFLKSHEVDMEVFKTEVPLNKKLLKQMEAVKPQKPQLQLETQTVIQVTAIPQKLELQPTVVPTSASAASSRASSFEEISKAMFDEPVRPSLSPEYSKTLLKMEVQLIAIAAEQKRIFGKLETLIDKVEQCENHVKDLKTDMNRKAIEDMVKMQGVVDVITDIRKKVDDIRKDESSSVGDILGLSSVLNNSLNL